MDLLFKGAGLHLRAVRALAAKLIKPGCAGSQAALSTQDIDAAFSYINRFDLPDTGVARVVWSAVQDSCRFTCQTALPVADDIATAHLAIVQRGVEVSVCTARAVAATRRARRDSARGYGC